MSYSQVQALCYKPEWRWYESRCGNQFFFSINLILPALPWGWGLLSLLSNSRLASKADNLTAICEPTVYTVWDA
jgi:hypothetical protein